jgi:predicted RecB family endonuclease
MASHKMSDTVYSYRAIIAAVLREVGLSEDPDVVTIAREPDNAPEIHIVSIDGGKASVVMVTKGMKLEDILRMGLC